MAQRAARPTTTQAVRATVKPKQADRLTSSLADNARSVESSLRESEILDGKRLTGLKSDAAGALSVRHGLGRQPKGWAIVDIDTAANVHRTAWDSDTIELTTSVGDVTIALWVF